MSPERTEVWSCGGGTQSGAIAVLIGSGKLPRPDICFMTDTGREKSGTWPFVDGFIRPQLARVGAELTIIKSADFATVDLIGLNGDILLPGFTKFSGEVGKLPAFCSNEWKQRPGMRWLRSLGIKSCRVWLGMSAEEARRIRVSGLYWMKYWYPLIFELRMLRNQCVALIRSTGWIGPIPHSACKMCPNMRDDEWIDLKVNFPGDFAEACQLEADLRAIDPLFYLHPSCVPLAEVDFMAQSTMFPDRGCATGCFT